MAGEQPSTRPGEPGSANDLAAASEQRAATPSPDQQRVPARPPRTRVSTAFSGFVVGVIVLVLLLIFILENTQSVKISWLGLGGHIALGVALLLAAVGGALAIGILGVARIAQVRRHAKRHARRQDHSMRPP